MHMKVADKLMYAELLPDRLFVQLYDRDGREYSSPILPGEAGFTFDSQTSEYVVRPEPEG